MASGRRIVAVQRDDGNAGLCDKGVVIGLYLVVTVGTAQDMSVSLHNVLRTLENPLEALHLAAILAARMRRD
ncbi:hypothetical protein ATH84_100218 [Paracoccus versutus]|uniref:Uncharacterized protein n=1 Tax=Paracoccus versutus TaxID=34007 RepID=A0AAQ0HKI6_PARVE|nr:hypothetical protein IT40_10330 [Paracoccus versutus]REG55579.1 hypothetical protein ATH84_100218 [Paracoccus versutus]